MERNDAVTIGRKLSSLRAFFRLAVRRRLVRGSPVAALRAPKRARRLPVFLGKDDVGRLLDGGGPRPDADAAIRSRSSSALFEVIYGAGLRVSEACGLDVGDVESDGARALRPRAPGQGAQGSRSCRSAARRAPRSTPARRSERAPAAAAGKGRDGRGRGGAVRHAAAACASGRARSAGCWSAASTVTGTPRVSPHALRHSFATHLLGEGPTCARSRRCSGTPACAPPSATPTSTSIT